MATVKKPMKKAQFGDAIKKLKSKYDSFIKKGDDDAAYTKKNLKTADSLRYANPKIGPKGLKGVVEEDGLKNKLKIAFFNGLGYTVGTIIFLFLRERF